METLRTVSHNVVHLRAKPGNDSELVSQLLMGQTVRVLREDSGWAYVEGEDTYRGWADTRWLGEHVTDELEPIVRPFVDMFQVPDTHSQLRMRLPMFARVRIESATENGYIEVTTPDRKTRGFLGAWQGGVQPLATVPDDAKTEVAGVFAQSFLGTPYLWGGSSSFGLDCSGFVQYVYRMVGIELRRDADIQRDDPRFVPAPVRDVAKAGDDLLPGDLVFFGKPDKITHVGMHLGNVLIPNSFIHSAGGAGVIITEWGDDRYSPGFVDTRRLDPAKAHEPVTRFESETR
ncbi:MAG: C40 family peptidase, partial [Armatimonadetes bacterium]|nr:C40 family peptidase [Armatimonadota bacterium]